MDIASNSSLLITAQALVDVEQSLTATLEKVVPWLLSATTTNIDPDRPRVRPTPQTIVQVHSILAAARNLASRTSAPAAWNPAAPVVGFSTPNPLPHQLRGGALAALQLERARQAERTRKRQRVQEDEEKKKAAKEAPQQQTGGKGDVTTARGDQHRAADRRAARVAGEIHARRNPQQQLLTTMNLSDSSCSDDDSDD